MTKNLVKNIIGNVALSYQVNLGIEIPNITENYINHTFSLVDIGYLHSTEFRAIYDGFLFYVII